MSRRRDLRQHVPKSRRLHPARERANKNRFVSSRFCNFCYLKLRQEERQREGISGLYGDSEVNTVDVNSLTVMIILKQKGLQSLL